MPRRGSRALVCFTAQNPQQPVAHFARGSVIIIIVIILFLRIFAPELLMTAALITFAY